MENFLPFSSNWNLLSANSFSLKESKICRLGENLALKKRSAVFPQQQKFGLNKVESTCRMNVAELMISLFDRVENIVGGKGEKTGSKHFLLFPKRFQKSYLPVLLTPDHQFRLLNLSKAISFRIFQIKKVSDENAKFDENGIK